jgi:hypothetical protein
MSEAWRRINLGIHRVLDEITLEQLVAPAEAPLRRMEVGAGPRPGADAPAAVAANTARGDGR